MVRYNYNRQVTPPAPFVHVSIHPPRPDASGVVVPAQLDSAADLSVIPARIVDELQLLPLENISALGFGGHLMSLPTYLVAFRIHDLAPIHVKALASPDEPFVLLGRDVLNQFKVTLDGPNLVVEIL